MFLLIFGASIVGVVVIVSLGQTNRERRWMPDIRRVA